METNYHIPNQMKTYICGDCNTEVSCLIWKTISKNLQGSEYKCENCWKKFDNNLEHFVSMKLHN